MVNKLKLAVIHFTHQNLMQIYACTWIYRWTKNPEKSGLGHPAAGHWPLGCRGPWTTGWWVFGPLGRRRPLGCRPVFSKTPGFRTFMEKLGEYFASFTCPIDIPSSPPPSFPHTHTPRASLYLDYYWSSTSGSRWLILLKKETRKP